MIPTKCSSNGNKNYFPCSDIIEQNCWMLTEFIALPECLPHIRDSAVGNRSLLCIKSCLSVRPHPNVLLLVCRVRKEFSCALLNLLLQIVVFSHGETCLHCKSVAKESWMVQWKLMRSSVKLLEASQGPDGHSQTNVNVTRSAFTGGALQALLEHCHLLLK